MSIILLILAIFSFICGFSFILAGSIGMQDFDDPKSTRGYVLWLVDHLFTGGLIEFVQSVIKNWSRRAYERRILMAGCGCLLLSVALVLLATRFP